MPGHPPPSLQHPVFSGSEQHEAAAGDTCHNLAKARFRPRKHSGRSGSARLGPAFSGCGPPLPSLCPWVCPGQPSPW